MNQARPLSLPGPLLALAFAALAAFDQPVHADAFKRNLFDLGAVLGSACHGSILSGQTTASNPQALRTLRSKLEAASEIGQRAANPMNSTRRLLAQIDGLSFQEIDQRLQTIQSEIQTQYSQGGSYVASSLFAMAIWLGGIECVAEINQGLPRSARPGSGDLIRRNLLWLQEQLRSPVFGLDPEPVDGLLASLGAGADFRAIAAQTRAIKEGWLADLEGQGSLGSDQETAVATEPQQETGDPCDEACRSYCEGTGRSAGRLGPDGLCMLGEISGDPASVCVCG